MLHIQLSFEKRRTTSVHYKSFAIIELSFSPFIKLKNRKKFPINIKLNNENLILTIALLTTNFA